MSNYPDPQSNFLVIGVVTRDPIQGPNFVFASVRDGDKLYLDVQCYEDGPLAEFRNLRSGHQVKIAGVLGRRKIKDVADLKGRPIYETTLVARKVAITGPTQYAPAVMAQPMYQPANPPGAPALTYPQWVAAQQTAAAPPSAPQGIPEPMNYQQWAASQQALQAGQPQAPQPPHPAQWDNPDKIPF